MTADPPLSLYAGWRWQDFHPFRCRCGEPLDRKMQEGGRKVNELTVIQNNALMDFAPAQVDLIKRTIAKNASDDQLAMFLYQAKRTGLDPLARQINCILRYNNKENRHDMSIQTSIDGYRLTADRTGKYAGSDDYRFDEGLSQYEHIQSGRGYPVTATVTVYKIVAGMSVQFTATAAWNSYYPGEGNPGFMWRKFPYLMIGKCAEALALRKAFPAELSGLYVAEEMEQAGFIDAAIIEAEAPKSAPKVEKPAPHQVPAKPAEKPNGNGKKTPAQVLVDAIDSECGGYYQGVPAHVYNAMGKRWPNFSDEADVAKYKSEAVKHANGKADVTAAAEAP